MKKWMILCLAALIALPGTATTNVFAEDNTTNTTTSNESSSVTNDTYSSGTPVTHVESTNTGVSSNQTNSKPVITLIGDAQIQIKVGSTFSDPGVTVQDDVYSDLKTANITYEYNGSPVTKVDTSLEGIFKIHYNVTNGDNVAADEVIRTVLVTSSKQYIDLSSVNLSNAYGMAYYGDNVYVAQRGVGISRVDLYTGKVTSIVKAARSFMGVALNSSGDLFYTIDSDSHIYKVSHKDMLELPLSNTAFNESSTVFFSDKYNYIYGLAIDAKDNVYFSDYSTKAILKIPAGTNSAQVVIENFTTSFTSFSFDLYGNLYTAGDNEKVYRISSKDLTTTPLQSSSLVNLNPNSYVSAYGIVFLSNGDSYIGSGGSMQKSPIQPIAPIIELLGSSQMTLNVGDTFVEPGVVVKDNAYPNLVATVSYTLNGTAVSSIDTNIAGTYTIYYNVTNPSNLSAEQVTRTVVVNKISGYFDLTNTNIQSPYGMAYHNGYVYVSSYQKGIDRVSVTTGEVEHIVKSSNSFFGVALNKAGDLFYTKNGDKHVYKISAKYLQDLPLDSANFNDYSNVFDSYNNTSMYGLAIDNNDNMYIGSYNYSSNSDSSLIKVNLTTKARQNVLTNNTNSNYHGILGVTTDAKGNLFYSSNEFLSVGLKKISYDHLQSLPVDNSLIESYPSDFSSAVGLVILPNSKEYYSNGISIRPFQKASPPVITLNGDYSVRLTQGDAYVDAGVAITDAVDSNLQPTITYTFKGEPVNAIDTSVVGEYIIHYNAKNSSGLSAQEVTRYVSVKAIPTDLTNVELNYPLELAYFDGDVYYSSYKGIYKVSATTLKATQIAKSESNITAVTVSKAGDIYYSQRGDSKVWVLKQKYLQNSELLPYSASDLEDYSTLYYSVPTQTLNPSSTSSNEVSIQTPVNSTSITGLAMDQQNRLYVATTTNNYFEEITTSTIVRVSSTELNSELVASYPTRISGITISQLGNLYVNIDSVGLYKAKASLLQNLPVGAQNFEMMGSKKYAYGVTFLPDRTGYISFEKSNVLTKLDFLDEAEVIPVTGVTLDKSTLEFKKKGAAQTLKATVTPDNATDSTVLWISSNPSVATVTDGVVTPIGKGTAVISAYSVTQKEIFASATVTVKESDDKTSSSGGSQKITLDVDDGKGKTTIPATAVVNRTTQANGQKQDQITFATDKVIEAITKLKDAAQQTVRLVVPDASDEVSQTDITLPLTAAKDLKNAAMNLEISTNDAKLSVASTSLNNITNDLYFHFVPLKTVAQQNAVANRAKQEQIVKQALGNGDISVVGRPMTIETNLQNQPVQLVMPIDNSSIPQDATAKQQWLNQLRIFIEHSDGDRELVQPSVVDYGNGQTGLQFTVNKFSTFTIVDMQNLASAPTNNSTTDNNNVNTDTTAGVVKPAYIQGYPDQTFRPNNSITRAEMASLLYRLQATAPKASASGNGSYSDVSATFWAHQAIASMQSTGLMKGLTNGKFAPAQPITRAEMAAIVSRWQGLSGTGSSFANDINGHWAANDIKRVTTAGLMQGVSPSSFQPDQPLTRAQAVTILNKILEKTAILTAGNKAWKDVPASHWAYADIMEASNSYTLK
ncbi:immunoglobulin-like domain-containing protein [Paenibacillus kyungheensis]